MKRRRWGGLSLLLCTIPFAFPACSDDDDPVATGWSQAQIAAAVDGILKTGLNGMSADAVAALFFDANPDNDPFVLDTRDAADFARGHIPGAVNVPLKEFPARYLAEGAALIPADRNVVVASYAGGDGNMASLLINVVRIEDPANAANFPWSKTIVMGMQSWTFDTVHSAGRRWPDDLGTYRVETATETTPHTGGDFANPAIPLIGGGTVEAAVLARADQFLQGVTDQLDLQHNAVTLKATLEDPDVSNDPQILSVRGAPHYALGHIPGAVNVGWKDVAELDLVEILDPTKPVVVYCYTGHTGSLATMAMGILGYDAKNLLYGMDGWHPSSDVNAGFLQDFNLKRGFDLPVVDGSPGDLDDLANYTPPAGCLDCHTDLTAVMYDLVVNAPVEPDQPPSVGEG